MDELTDVQRLLRLKRYEAPAPEYFEDFLREIHQRQRAEMLKRPIWRLMLDRLEAALPTVQIQQYAFAGSCALALLVAGVSAERILTSPAGKTLAAGSINSHFGGIDRRIAVGPAIDFYTSKPAFRLSELDFDHPRQAAAYNTAAAPRYVLDSQPASYGQPYSF